jgi:phosphatidylglycerol:prolipoprotein diacylglycerol transferase
MTALVYPLLAVLGIAVSAYLWDRATTERATRERLQLVFLGGLFGMGVGSVLGFALAEGLWRVPLGASLGALDTWRVILGGKTVLGGLLGAYAGVELAKRALSHREPTGDLFALMVPFSLLLGRVGCLVEGCCLGQPIEHVWYALDDAHGTPRWPAALIELAFNALIGLALYAWSSRPADPARSNRLRGQLFHVYMIAYGVFRFAHEPLRDTPRVWHGASLYQLLALALALLGALRFMQRSGANVTPARRTQPTAAAGPAPPT